MFKNKLHIFYAFQIFLTLGWLAATFVLKNTTNKHQHVDVNPDGTLTITPFKGFNDTRLAYLFFTISGFAVYYTIFLLEYLNLTSAFGFLERLPFDMIVLGIDIFYMLSLMGVSIAAAIRESELDDFSDSSLVYSIWLNNAFAFMSVSFLKFCNPKCSHRP